LKIENPSEQLQRPQDIRAIEDDVRSALRATRKLLEMLTGTDIKGSEPEYEEYFSDIVRSLIEDLEDSGFTVVRKQWSVCQYPLDIRWRSVVASVFAEIGQNLQKYADRDNPIEIRVNSSEGILEASVVNGIAGKTRDELKSSEIGLSLLDNMVTSLGGWIESEASANKEWTTRLTIPLNR